MLIPDSVGCWAKWKSNAKCSTQGLSPHLSLIWKGIQKSRISQPLAHSSHRSITGSLVTVTHTHHTHSATFLFSSPNTKCHPRLHSCIFTKWNTATFPGGKHCNVPEGASCPWFKRWRSQASHFQLKRTRVGPAAIPGSRWALNTYAHAKYAHVLTVECVTSKFTAPNKSMCWKYSYLPTVCLLEHSGDQ